MNMLSDTRYGSGGFCRARAAPGGYGRNRSESSVGGSKFYPRPGRQSPVVTAAVTRATNHPEGAERSPILIRGPSVRKLQKSEAVKGSPPKTTFLGWGTSLLKPTPGIGGAPVRSPQPRMRKIPTSSTGMRLLNPVRSCFEADSGKRDRKSAFPFGLPLRCSRV